MPLHRSFFRAAQAVGQHISAEPERLQALLCSRPVGVKLGSCVNHSGNFSVIAEIVINLMARFYPDISISGDKHASNWARKLAKEVNPKINFIKSSIKCQNSIAIGCGPNNTSSIFPHSDGWVAGLSVSWISSEGAFNPIAATFAGALATAELFKRVFFEELEDRTSLAGQQVSLLDYTSSGGLGLELRSANIGETAFVGLGAVGNATLWALSKLADLSGKAYLIDHQKIELSNLQRYVLAMDSHENALKTDIAERALVGKTIILEKRPQKLNEFAALFSDSFAIPTICVSVDNIPDRRIAQALLPKLVVNGFTGEGSIGISWHRFGVERRRCLACMYNYAHPASEMQRMEEVLGLPKIQLANLYAPGAMLTKELLDIVAQHNGCEPNRFTEWIGKSIRDFFQQLTCGELGVGILARGKAETVPLAHQSVLAGAMLAAELIKRTTPNLEERAQIAEQIQWSDVTRTFPSNWVHTFPRTLGCICSDEVYLDVYRTKWVQYSASQ